MDEEDFWQDNVESGITPGPEEALRLEIEKSKALKVERLQLRNEIEYLRSENRQLLEENQELKEKLLLPGGIGVDTPKPEPKLPAFFPFATNLLIGLLILIFVICIFFYYTLGR